MEPQTPKPRSPDPPRDPLWAHSFFVICIIFYVYLGLRDRRMLIVLASMLVRVPLWRTHGAPVSPCCGIMHADIHCTWIYNAIDSAVLVAPILCEILRGSRVSMAARQVGEPCRVHGALISYFNNSSDCDFGLVARIYWLARLDQGLWLLLGWSLRPVLWLPA
jgi:hypothetical protein